MASGYTWSRRVVACTRTLRCLVRDTQRALDDVCDILHFAIIKKNHTCPLASDPEVPTTVQQIGNHAARTTALVILGTSPAARARLLHCLLGHPLLPDPPPRGCRWVRIQYGSSTQVHLSLGNSEFELVEELECNKRSWETLPVEDLVRQGKSDMTTILEVEINNQFLKNGVRIIIPPDLDVDPGISSHLTLKKLHSDLYLKRDSILKNFNPIYLYAVDKTGKNIFSDSISADMVSSRSEEEDFWNTFNLYSMAGSGKEAGDTESTESVNGDKRGDVKRKWSSQVNREPAVFSGENCLDLNQIKEINPNAQVLFMLFSDSEDMSLPGGHKKPVEVKKEQRINIDALNWIFKQTQEYSQQKNPEDLKRLHEEQTTFMNELMEQWEFMTSPPPKHYVKSQWLILNDFNQCTVDQKASLPLSNNTVQSANETCLNGKLDEKTVKTRTGLLTTVMKFATDCMQSYLLEYCTRLSEVHVKLLQQFILASFDMARELQVVPKKIQYVAKQEQQLYETINEKFSEGDKKQELVQIMQEVLQEMRTEVNNMDWSVDDLPCHRDTSFLVSNSIFYSSSTRSTPSIASLRTCAYEQPSDSEDALSLDTYNFDDYDIIPHEEEVSETTEDSFGKVKSQESESPYNIRVENESEMYSLSSSGWSGGTTCTSTRNISVKQASLDVQRTVLSKLSQKISLKLVKFVECLKVTYFGTLQRCLESLESSCRQELGGRPASEAMRQLLSVARQVDLSPCAAFPLLTSLLESLRRILYKLRLVGGEGEEACCALSPRWRRRVAASALHQLSPQRLAKLISAQILERLSMAHERYQSALMSLESALAGRLHHTGDIKLAIRKKYAPTFARLCLESTSMCDLLMYGTPELGREIGRGQYGVVYSVRGSWGGKSPVAVKSVLPADDRHYRELAMEFFYTRSIPAHPRIVRLYGSVVQRSQAGSCVLLVSERKVRDLHAAVRAGLTFSSRMRIAADIVEGIRYLHSLGLVHRDIKMKNVLLDSMDRAALSDLGFCAAEALISGSVVGTPVHMAPELLAGEYDASVDVYAFGILFWYVCAGNIKLPSAFDFQNKEQLWSKVKRGRRPERLPQFSDECWDIMESCWASEPSQRALLGDIQARLERIMATAHDEPNLQQECVDPAVFETDDYSLEMTGIEKNCV
ncbi:unnamed protein product [Arctia plantaginis]|uniref:Dual serine/threonine and tyrosine protein kinase n=1 Tax=Arctia plantaginis TaxID=874455 RepID=A0A8S1A657_ARCPL|nr:unnamed protein product [Arctia plantaginis]